MALNKTELLLVEAMRSMLTQDAKLGLSIHNNSSAKEFEIERSFEHMHGQIDEMFEVKAAELTHANGICSSFRKVHSYKYLDDPSFRTAMEKEMVAQAIPAEERNKALGFVPKIIDELREEKKEWAEKDSGFNPKLDEIMELSRPGDKMGEFTIHDQEGYNKKNVTSKSGEASPSRTPSDT